MKWANVAFKAESELVRWWYRQTHQTPSSEPYISGDSLRAWADWTYEPANRGQFEPQSVATGSLGFCDGWILKEFLTQVAPRIVGPFRLISHNADPNVTTDIANLLPSNLTTLYAMNKVVEDHRLVALPIGLENARYHYNGVVRDFQRLRRRATPKKPRVLAAFTVGTNPIIRGQALSALSSLETVDWLDRINSRAYRRIARGYQFIASPPGNGEDCHRTWEALYLGCIPIVLRSVMTEEFARRGLPLWIVDTYSELSGLRESDLASKYEELSPGLASEWLWMDAWKEILLNGAS